MKKAFIIIFSTLILAGCQKEKVNNSQPKLNDSSLKNLLLRAANGIKTANDSLSGLFDLNLPNNKSYNSLTVNNLQLASGEKMYFVLLEYPNPVYNRFAVYDENLKSFLIDKSLNGQLSQKLLEINGENFIEINEGFLTKDIIQLSRISLYKILNDDVFLIFRDFTKIKLPNREYNQTIEKFSDNQIETKISSTRKNYTPRQEIFSLNPENKMYESKKNVFKALVNYLLNNFNRKLKNPQITDKKSAEESLKNNF